MLWNHLTVSKHGLLAPFKNVVLELVVSFVWQLPQQQQSQKLPNVTIWNHLTVSKHGLLAPFKNVALEIVVSFVWQLLQQQQSQE